MSICIKCKAELVDGSVYCHMCGKKQIAEPRKTLKRANGTGTVYKKAGRRRKPWFAEKNHVIIGSFERKTDALEALDKFAKKSVTELYNYTFEQVFNAWSEEHFRRLSVHGMNNYKTAYIAYVPLYNRKFRELKTADFQSIVDAHLDKSHSLLAKYKNLATQMSKWAMREEIITTNFASFVQLPPNVKKEKQTFTENDIALLEADGSETAKIILMLIYTGMRIGELFQMTTDHVYDTYCIGGEKTEAGRNRVIPIRPEGRAYFQYFKGIATGELLLSGYSGAQEIANFRNRNYFPLLKKLGIERKTPHCTRHTFASWASHKGIPPETLQKILGHSKFSTTAEIYIHANVDQLVSAIENVSNFVSNPKQTEADQSR